MAERNWQGEYDDDWREEPRGSRARGPQRSQRYGYGEYEGDDERRRQRADELRDYSHYDPESRRYRENTTRGQRGYSEETRRQQEGRGFYDDDWRSPTRDENRPEQRYQSPYQSNPYSSSNWRTQRGSQYESERRPWQSNNEESSQSYSDRSGMSGYQPSTWSYYEFWMIPGPHAGRGPQGYQRSAERIKEDICDRLESHGNIDASKIQVQVNEGGEVTLSGTVSNRTAKRLADDVADSVRGVKDVHNQLRVEQSNNASTSDHGAKKQQSKP